MSFPLSAHYRTAFVTGASTGLGLAFAEMLLGEGITVWGTSRDLRRLPARPNFHPVQLELREGAAAVSAFGAAERAADGFDIVVNNAGSGAFGDFVATDFAVWETQLQAMLVNTARLAQAALRGMRRRNRGALVNISSLAAEFPLPFQPAYNMAKAGLSALSESLMYEVRGTGVIVIDFRPGDYRTEFEGAVQRPAELTEPAQRRAWEAFARMMASGPPPAHAAEALRRALRRRRNATVRTGRAFQARLAPLLARLGSLGIKRAVQARYFDLP